MRLIRSEARMSKEWVRMNQVILHNVRLSSRFLVICHSSFSRLFFALRTIRNVFPPVPRRGTNQRARSERSIVKEQPAERGVPEQFGTQQQCQEPLTRRPAVRGANAASNPPK